MRPIKANKRDKVHTFRLTEAEEAQVRSDMASLDCLSVSKYVRYLLLRKRPAAKPVRMTDRVIRNQINELSAKISRIGSNYNQVVRKYNTSCSARKNNGDPVINTRATVFYMERLSNLTEELRSAHKSLVERVSLLRVDDEN